MSTRKPKTLVLPFLLILILGLLIACGTSTASTQVPVEPESAEAMATEGETMASEGEAMATEGEAMASEGEAMTMNRSKLVLDVSGFQPLNNGVHFEGWVIIDGVPVTTGKFNVDGGGALVALDGSPIAGGEFYVDADLSNAGAVVITIEPDGDTDMIPADTHYLAGSVAGGSADLTVGHGAALGDDFAGATGVYILATPTNDPAADENSGIWFLDLSSGSPAVGLDLPVLPTGWEYEGWAVIEGMPVSTGRFTALDQADFSDRFSGPESGPPFPGEDFLVNAPDGLSFPTDLAGKAGVISIEPTPDDSDAPFTLKPLFGSIPDDATDHTNYSLNNNSTGFPSGTATIMGGAMTQ